MEAMAKRLWHIVRIVYYMIRKGISKRKLMMDLNLLLQRGKIAGKAIGNLMFHHHNHDNNNAATTTTATTATGGGVGGYYSSLSCRSMDPNLSFYDPREVEFSCSNTPSYPFHVSKRKRHHHHHHRRYGYDAAAVRKAFEILNSHQAAVAQPESPDVAATPSPASFWSFGRSPAVVRQLRITDSPFPIMEEEGDVDCHVDREAEEFIQRFYEQLRMQQRTSSLETLHGRPGSVYA